MPKTNSILTSKTKYFKLRAGDTDNWYCGKTDGQIPKNSVSISMFKYFEMAYGKKALEKAMKELKKISGVTGRGTIEIATSQDISHLPDANSPEYKHLIN